MPMRSRCNGKGTGQGKIRVPASKSSCLHRTSAEYLMSRAIDLGIVGHLSRYTAPGRSHHNPYLTVVCVVSLADLI